MGNPEGRQPVDKLIADRRAKLDAVRDLGVDPFPHRVTVSESVSDVVARWSETPGDELEASEVTVQVAGRVKALRSFGKAAFVDLNDGASRLQAYVRRDRIDPSSWQVFTNVDLGDFLAVEGSLFRTRTDELSVAVERLSLIGKSLRPLPEKFHGLSDRELCARQRYLDLIANPESRQVFEARSRIVSAVRRFLNDRGFLEVETPMMQPIPGGASARPFVTHHNTYGIDLYMRIAPELYLKRLLVGGFERVFELNRNFRNEGVSTRHNPEFSMLEFYWAYADYEQLAELTEELVTSVALEVTGTLTIPWGESTVNLERPWRKLTLRDAILAYSDLTPEDLGERSRMESAARGLGVERIDERSDGKLIAELFEVTAESQLIDPTFIIDFPRDISPLAKAKPDDPSTVERFELFVGGLEVANAYTELNDPIEQRLRMEEQVASGGGVVDEDFVRALEHGMPPAGGEGIGVDRLVMLLTNRASIRDVILFPQLRPRTADTDGTA
jgi:lysyl-tRNA synthetase class 2